LIDELEFLKQTQGRVASWSLSEKYQCPLGYTLALDTSPTTKNESNSPSRTSLILPVN